MAKINAPRQTVFSDPSAIRRTGGGGGGGSVIRVGGGAAGLEHRLEAQRIAGITETVSRVANFASDAIAFGQDLKTLTDQKVSGEFLVAKANAEERVRRENQRAVDPEPISERRQFLPGSPYREKSDEDLYEERSLELSGDLQEIGSELRGKSKQAYDLWLATKSPEWQGDLLKSYSDRVRAESVSDLNIAIGSHVRAGDVPGIIETYQIGIDQGIVRKADVAERMIEDISSAVFTNILSNATDIAEGRGVDAEGNPIPAGLESATAYLDSIKDIARAEGYDTYLDDKQLENIRSEVQLRLTDQAQQDDRIYKEQTLRPTESVLQEAMNSYVRGTNFRETGAPLASAQVDALIQGSDLFGADKLRWDNTLTAAQHDFATDEEKRLAQLEKEELEAEDAVIELLRREAVNKSMDATITPQAYQDWINTQVGPGKLDSTDMQNFIGDKERYFYNENWKTAAEVGVFMLEQGAISEVQYQSSMADVREWSRSDEGAKIISTQPDAVVTRMELEAGKRALDKLITESNGQFNKDFFTDETAIIRQIRRSAIVTDPTLEVDSGQLKITSIPAPQLVQTSSLSKTFDDIEVNRIRTETEHVPTDYGIAPDVFDFTSGVGVPLEGYLILADPSTNAYDFIKVDPRGNVLFWDANEKITVGKSKFLGAWKPYGKRRFRKRENK